MERELKNGKKRQKAGETTQICDVFLQQTVYLRLCVTQITKIGD
jgi:hypothetical protein